MQLFKVFLNFGTALCSLIIISSTSWHYTWGDISEMTLGYFYAGSSENLFVFFKNMVTIFEKCPCFSKKKIGASKFVQVTQTIVVFLNINCFKKMFTISKKCPKNFNVRIYLCCLLLNFGLLLVHLQSLEPLVGTTPSKVYKRSLVQLYTRAHQLFTISNIIYAFKKQTRGARRASEVLWARPLIK